MKKLILSILALFFATMLCCQNYGMKWSEKDPAHYYFGSVAIDVNQNFGWWDNPRMEKETVGFQWQADAGIRFKQFELYGFYGRADFIDYMIWGAGFNIYPNWLYESDIDMGVGVALSCPYWKGNTAWHNDGYIAFRANVQWWFMTNIAGGLRYIKQHRPNTTKGWIDEGQIYIAIKLDRD